MALQLKYSDQFGVDHPDAYWKLTGFEYSSEQKIARLTFSVYANKDAKEAGGMNFAIKQFALTGAEFDQVDAMLQAGFKSQVYEYAKTKKEVAEGDEFIFFEGAKDV